MNASSVFRQCLHESKMCTSHRIRSSRMVHPDSTEEIRYARERAHSRGCARCNFTLSLFRLCTSHINIRVTPRVGCVGSSPPSEMTHCTAANLRCRHANWGRVATVGSFRCRTDAYSERDENLPIVTAHLSSRPFPSALTHRHACRTRTDSRALERRPVVGARGARSTVIERGPHERENADQRFGRERVEPAH